MEPTKRETQEHKVICRPPAGDHCFGCRAGEAQCLAVRVYRMDDGSVVSLVHTDESHQSFKGIVHGGIVCSYLDEVLSYNTWSDEDYDAIAMTVEMNIKYYVPVPVDTDIRIIGDAPVIERRHYYISGRVLLPDDTVAAEAKIHYIKLRNEDERNKEECVERTERADARETITY